VADRVGVRAVVSGEVQGVWFRDSCRNEAKRLGVSGWVRNREDGRVEFVAEGPEHAVAALVSWARLGPPRADVSGVAVEYVEPTGATTFVIR
jgi:acylphosphatase